MLFKKEIRKPIFALVLFSLGGWLLHYRIHPITSDNPSFFVPFMIGILNVIVTPILLNSKKTIIVGYLINGFSVIIGTVTMAHLSLSGLIESFSFMNLLFKSTLAHILILLSKLLIAQTILMHYFPTGLGRFFTTSWWVRHFCYFTMVYVFGNFIWR